MSLFTRRVTAETRDLTFQDVWGSGDDVDCGTAGRDIGAAGLRLIPVYAATSLIADLLSTSRLTCYRAGSDGSRTALTSQPTLVTNPSPFGNVVDWLHQCFSSLLLRGNAIGYITAYDGAGRPAKIIWFHPDDVAVIEEQMDWFHTPTYYWRGRLLDTQRVVHITGYTFPGSVMGFSPLGLFKTQIETGLRAQKFGDDWFRNAAVPSGHLKNTVVQTLPAEKASAAKATFKAAVTNRDVLVTGADWDWKSLSVSADESQFLATIQATATQIAAIYRVSPEDIGGQTANSLTYKTLEQDNAKLTSRTLGTWARRIEEALDALLPRPQYVKFDLDRLARGDLTSRMVAHTAALSAGVETLDEARASEDKPPLTDEQIQQWQEWFRTSSPSMPGTPSTSSPSPFKGVTGGPNA